MDNEFSLGRYGRLLLRYLRPQNRRVLLLALLIMAGITLQLLNPLLVRRFLDGAEAGQDLRQLVQTALLFMAVAILAQAFKLVATYVGENVAWRATNELRADLALHCLRLDMTFHKRYKPGELIERVDGDVNQLANFFSQLVIQLASNLLLIAGVMVLLWLVDWRVGLVVTLLSAASLIILNILNRRLVPRWQEVRQVESDLFGYVEEWLSGTEEIQTNRAAPYAMDRLYGLLRRRWYAKRSAMQLNFAVMALPIVIPSLAYVVAYLWGSALFTQSVVTIGTIYLVVYYIDVIKGPLWVIQRQVQDLQRAAASLNRISLLFDEQPTLFDGPVNELPDGPLAVDFDHVWFHYADDEHSHVLQDIDFRLEPGKVLGLLGRTGSGKTTMTRLLFRFYDVTGGGIRLAGDDGKWIDVRRAAQAALRERIGLVTQDVQLFHASVRDNLTLFDDSIADEGIVDALETLGLRPWLEAMPAGLDTRLEAGESLSAGEAQLLALGRVFLADPGLVVLDEASSRLDPATEYLLEKAIDKLLAGRTAIIIAHRLATVQRADEIMILSDGHVVEHSERALLVANPDSHFAELLRTGLEEAMA